MVGYLSGRLGHRGWRECGSQTWTELLGTSSCFPWPLKSTHHSSLHSGQDLQQAKAAALTQVGRLFAGLGFSTGVGNEAEAGPSSSYMGLWASGTEAPRSARA
jgi:hypothetical protein